MNSDTSKNIYSSSQFEGNKLLSEGLYELIHQLRNCKETLSFSNAIASFGTEKYYKLVKSESFDVGFTRPLHTLLFQKKPRKKHYAFNLKIILDNIINIIWIRLFSLTFVCSRFRFKIIANLRRLFIHYKSKTGVFKLIEKNTNFDKDMDEVNNFYNLYLETNRLYRDSLLNSLIGKDNTDDIRSSITNHFLVKNFFKQGNESIDTIYLEKYNLIDFSKELEYTPQEMLVLLSTSTNEEIINNIYNKIEDLLANTDKSKTGIQEKLNALVRVKDKKTPPNFVFDSRWVKKSKRATLRQGNVEDKNLDRIDNKAKFKKDQLKIKFSKITKRKRGRK